MGAKKKEALEQFNRENILAAASELFSKKGVEKTTMDDIANFADYSKSTIYVYFRSKEDIYNAILLKRYTDLILDVDNLSIESEDYRTVFNKLCNCLVEFERSYPKYFLSLLGEGKATNSRKVVDFSNNSDSKDMTFVFEKYLEDGKRRKLINKNVDVKKMSMYMWTTVGGAIRYAGQKPEFIKKHLGITKDEYLAFCFDNLYKFITA